MSNCEGCPSESSCTTQESCQVENNPLNHVKNIIAIMSGKGGVGKSSISTLIAKTLRSKGYEVGLMDADATGPSIPRLMGITKGERVYGEEGKGFIPILSTEGIKVISLNLLMADEEQPVIWRGPMVGNAVKQFWTDVYWGDLDYLIIDMPPGTSDVPLTVMQSIPITAAIAVSTPQDMVSMIVAKSINMAKAMKIPVIGIVENMSYIVCPDCGKKIKMFEQTDLLQYSEHMGVKILGEFPMNSDVANLATRQELPQDEEVKGTLDHIVEEIVNYNK